MADEPIRENKSLHTREAAVTVPAEQTGLVASATFIAVFVLGIIFGTEALAAFKGAIVVGILAGVLYLFGRLYRWDKLTALQRFETIVHQDLDGDGYAGAPPPEAPAPQATIRVHQIFYDKDGKFKMGAFQEVDDRLLWLVADGIYNRGIAFSNANFVGQYKILVRSEFDIITGADPKSKVQNWMDDENGLGYFHWRNASHKQSGCEVTEVGEQTFKERLKTPPPPGVKVQEKA